MGSKITHLGSKLIGSDLGNLNKTLSHFKFFVLHDRATQLINTFLLSEAASNIARSCNKCCMIVQITAATRNFSCFELRHSLFPTPITGNLPFSKDDLAISNWINSTNEVQSKCMGYCTKVLHKLNDFQFVQYICSINFLLSE